MSSRVYPNSRSSRENGNGKEKENPMVEVIKDTCAKVKQNVTKGVLQCAYSLGLGYAKDGDSFMQYRLKLLREAIVNVQTEQHRQQTGPYSLFLTVIKGDFEELKELVIRDPLHKKIYRFDAAGANIVHTAYLYEQYEIGHFLVENFPRLALERYKGDVAGEVEKKLSGINFDKLRGQNLMPYAGENILHMTIVRRNYKEVRWLLDFYRDHKDFYVPPAPERSFVGTVAQSSNGGKGKLQPQVSSLASLHGAESLALYTSAATGSAVGGSGIGVQPAAEPRHIDGLSTLLKANAHGNFFDPTGNFYFGGYPLQFAVCSNDTEIFDLVFAFVSMAGSNSPDGGGEGAAKTELSLNVNSAQNAIFEKDGFGNTVLHLCVLHGLKEMYAHVYKTALDITTRELKLLYAKYTDKYEGTLVTLNSDNRGEEELTGDQLRGYSVKSAQVVIPSKNKYRQWLEEEARRIVDERLVLALNEDLHSPLTLAASLIKKAGPSEAEQEQCRKRVGMFEFLLGHLKDQLWQFGPVGMALLDLEGVEIKYRLHEKYDLRGREAKVAKKEFHAAIDWLCINDADEAIKVHMIRKLIETKWERVGYPEFLVGFAIHLFVAIMVTLILVFANASPTLYPTHSTQWMADFLYPVVALMFFVMFCMEVNDWVAFRAFYWKFRGVAKFNKIMRVLKIFSFVSFCCCKAVTANGGKLDEENSVHGATVFYDREDDIAIKFTLTICIITCWMHMYFFFMGFDATGPFILTLFRIVANDIPYFLNFYMIVVFAFGAALSLLSNDGNFRAGYGFLHLLKAIWTLIQFTVGVGDTTQDNISIADNVSVSLQWWADILLTMYFTSVILIMLNLLIALISATYEQYTQYSDAILLMEKYNIMHAMEKAYTDQEMRESRHKYHAHILEPDPIDRYTELHKRNPAGFSGKEGNAADGDDDDDDDDAGDENGFTASAQLVPSAKASTSPTTAHAAVAVAATDGSSRPAILAPAAAVGKFHRKQSISERFAPIKHSVSTMAVPRKQKMLTKFEIQSVNRDWWSQEQVEADEEAGMKGGLDDFISGCKKTTLFIIDPQNDFHPEGGSIELSTYHVRGSLAVEGANEDTHRISEMIDKYGQYIHEIFVSLDSHYPCHIAHAVSWKDEDGNHPNAFESIRYDDVRSGKWIYQDTSDDALDWALYYTSQLERKKKQVLTIWPEHCIVGSKGHGIVPELNQALQRWARRSKRTIFYVMKGQNLRTEMYSALEAEVEDPNDPNTSLNAPLVAMLKVSDRLIICGEAMSHCVNFTTRDIMNHWDGDLSELVLLTDAASPVIGCNQIAEDFVRNCQDRGVTLSTTAQVFEGFPAAALPTPTAVIVDAALAAGSVSLKHSSSKLGVEAKAQDVEDNEMTIDSVNSSN